MVGSLKSFLIFLHGISGSGKGVIRGVLTEKFVASGYEVMYLSSGDLFRAAFADPSIAAMVNRGIFVDTLGTILSGLERVVGLFLSNWQQAEGKVILVLDGFVRHPRSVKVDGQVTPSQFEQVVSAFHNVLQRLTRQDRRLLRFFPEYGESSAQVDMLPLVARALKEATHIVTSIIPEDAEKQMVSRSIMQIESITRQIAERERAGLLTRDQQQVVEYYLSRFRAILLGGIKYVDDQVVWLPPDEWGHDLGPALYPKAVEEVNKTRQSLAEGLGLKKSSTLEQIFAFLGVSSELRDDDIPDFGRKKRMENYIANYITRRDSQAERPYEPGFATLALTEDLCFSFQKDGSFTSDSENCVVIPNGPSKGIDLLSLQQSVVPVAERVFSSTEANRVLFFGVGGETA